MLRELVDSYYLSSLSNTEGLDIEINGEGYVLNFLLLT
jgi:hypothetical protein